LLKNILNNNITNSSVKKNVELFGYKIGSKYIGKNGKAFISHIVAPIFLIVGN
jgi:hypothetical protein